MNDAREGMGFTHLT